VAKVTGRPLAAAGLSAASR